MKVLYYELMEKSKSQDDLLVRTEYYMDLFMDETISLSEDKLVNDWFDDKIIPAIIKDLEISKPNLSNAQRSKAVAGTVADAIDTLGFVMEYIRRELVPRGNKLCKFAFDEISPDAWAKHKQSNLVEAHNYNILRVIPNLSRLTSFAALLEPLTGIIVASNNLFFFRQNELLTRSLKRVTRNAQEEQNEKELIARGLECNVEIPDFKLAKKLQKARRAIRDSAFEVHWADKYVAHLVALAIDEEEEDEEEDYAAATQNSNLQLDVEQGAFVPMVQRASSSVPATASNTEKSTGV